MKLHSAFAIRPSSLALALASLVIAAAGHVGAQTKAVLKTISSDALTETIKVASGKQIVALSGSTITINAGATIVNNGTATGFGSGGALATLTDVTLTSLADLDFLRYDLASGKWINRTPADARADLGLGTMAMQPATSPTIATSIITGSSSFTAFAGATVQLTIGGTGATSVVSIPGTKAATATTGALLVNGGIAALKNSVFNSVIVGRGSSSGTGNLTIGQSTAIAGTGNDNTAVGLGALSNATGTTDSNTAVGSNALLSVDGGNGNVALGAHAGDQITTGANNTIIGTHALNIGGTGSRNIIIGYNTASALNGGNDNIFIGYTGAANSSGQIRIGDAGTHTDTYLTGIIHGDGGEISNLNAAALVGTIAATNFPAFTGDVTTPAGSVATTLATVNSNVGTFGSATKSVTVTVNGKGLVTAMSEQTITPSIASVTGLGSNVGNLLATFTKANLDTAISDDNGAYVGTANNFTAAQTITNDGLAATTAAGATLVNTTDATNSVQVQVSPALLLQGEAWRSGNSTNHTTAFRNYVLPIAGTSADPTAKWTIQKSIDGEAAVDLFTVLATKSSSETTIGVATSGGVTWTLQTVSGQYANYNLGSGGHYFTGGGVSQFYIDYNRVTIGAALPLGWVASGAATGTQDTSFYRDGGAGIVKLIGSSAAGKLRTYDSGGTKYAQITHDGTDAVLTASSGGLKLGTGSTAISKIKHGTATLSSGTATVTDSDVVAGSRIFVNRQSDGGTVGDSFSIVITAASQFTITSKTANLTVTGDTSTVSWIMFNP